MSIQSIQKGLTQVNDYNERFSQVSERLFGAIDAEDESVVVKDLFELLLGDARRLELLEGLNEEVIAVLQDLSTAEDTDSKAIADLILSIKELCSIQGIEDSFFISFLLKNTLKSVLDEARTSLLSLIQASFQEKVQNRAAFVLLMLSGPAVSEETAFMPETAKNIEQLRTIALRGQSATTLLAELFANAEKAFAKRKLVQVKLEKLSSESDEPGHIEARMVERAEACAMHPRLSEILFKNKASFFAAILTRLKYTPAKASETVVASRFFSLLIAAHELAISLIWFQGNQILRELENVSKRSLEVSVNPRELAFDRTSEIFRYFTEKIKCDLTTERDIDEVSIKEKIEGAISKTKEFLERERSLYLLEELQENLLQIADMLKEVDSAASCRFSFFSRALEQKEKLSKSDAETLLYHLMLELMFFESGNFRSIKEDVRAYARRSLLRV